MSERLPQVNQLIKKELSRIILKEFEFPEGVLVTLTRVETTPNLNESKIYISVMPENYFKKALQVLKENIYILQQYLNKRLKMRPVPRIKFVEEKETVKASKIEEILERLKKKEK